jgi:uncharacterized protein (DUF302 family)
MKRLLLSAVITVAGMAANADGVVTYTTDDSFDDVIFGLESAILDEGLVIDSISKVGDMLERTKGDVGSDVTIFTGAEVYSFCSATLSRKVMEADPLNVQFCPYGIFVSQTPEQGDMVTIGYRSMPEGVMKEVEALLDTIARAAIGLE